ncbi:MAG: STAS domain-containing protein [Bacteroidia bacterium]
MEIREFQESSFVRLQPVGDLDAQSSMDMDSCIRKYVDNGQVNLLIDGTDLVYISSAGLGVFISYLDDLKAAGGQMAFSNLSEEVFDVFELLGLTRLVSIVEKAEAASPLFNI